MSIIRRGQLLHVSVPILLMFYKEMSEERQNVTVETVGLPVCLGMVRCSLAFPNAELSTDEFDEPGCEFRPFVVEDPVNDYVWHHPILDERRRGGVRGRRISEMNPTSEF